MTVKKTSRTGGRAAIVARQKLHKANQQIDILSITKSSAVQSYNIVIGFNEKDQLQLQTKDDVDDDEKRKIKDFVENKASKCENISIDDITNCVNIENYPNCSNTLVFYTNKNSVQEAITVKFENDQDFKRIYFTYKYFKMRNRLTQNTNYHTNTDSLFGKKKTYDTYKTKIDDYNSFDTHRLNFDYTIDNHHRTSRFDQPMSLINIKSEGEIDNIIYTDVDVPTKPDKKRFFQKKPKASSPQLIPNNKDGQMKILKGEFVRVNVERIPDIIPKEHRLNKVPDILMPKENKPKKISPPSNLWSVSNKVTTGYESDREEWRSSRSQFSTTAFDSLARPTKMAMALTLRKPPRLEPIPQYYRLPNDANKLTPVQYRPIMQRPRLQRPVEVRNLTVEHRKYTSLLNLELPKKLSEPKKQDSKRNYTNLSHKISGLTNKLRDHFPNPTNTLGRFKAQSHGDVANLKPVLKTDGGKRSVVRTCSAEPPKKVTFSAFATVQVV